MRQIVFLLLVTLTGLDAQSRRITPLGAHGKRVALLIGNDDYKPLPRLTNAVNDVREMAKVLGELGFEVLVVENASRERMDQGVNDFIDKLRSGDIALFYYSGHAMQINGENYLAPVDLEVANEIQARNRSMSASEILGQMEAAGSDLQIVILDACRNNPFAGRARSIGGHGLAPMYAGKGTFIAYATAPGQTASDNAGEGNGLYTKCLLEALREPGLPLDAVFDQANGMVQEASRGKQIPWKESSVKGVFYFRPAAGVAEAHVGRALDEEAWESIRDSRQQRVFQRFIETYPDSRYVSVARLRLEALSPDAPGGARIVQGGNGADAASLREQYNQGFRLERIGRAKEALQKYADAYEQGRQAIAILPAGHHPGSELEAVFVDIVDRYGWALFDIGRVKDSEEVQHVLEAMMGPFETRSVPQVSVLTYLKYENTERRFYARQNNTDESKRHLLRASDLAARATAVPDAGIDALWLAYVTYRNRSYDAEGAAKDQLLQSACAFADRMVVKSPTDPIAIDATEDCMVVQSGSIKDAAAKVRKLNAGQKVLMDALKRLPDDRPTLLSMASIENGLANAAENSGKSTEATAHRMSAQDYFVRALHGKTVFPDHPYGIKEIYQDLRRFDFSNVEKEVAYYKEVSEAVAADAEAFPGARTIAYIKADAAAHIGGALSPDDQSKAAAETWLVNALDEYARAGVMDDLSSFTEDFASYCRASSQLIQAYGKAGKLSPMLAVAKTSVATCSAALEKYPWDFYLRANLIASMNSVGQFLVGQKEAVLFLEYASLWANAQSTRTLAKVYREGLGVPKDLKKAQELESVAAKQKTESFTVQVDFGGVKYPFQVHVADWPSEYPFEGIDDQVKWLKEARGGIVPPDVVEAFRQVYKEAKNRHQSYAALAVEKLGRDPKGK